MGGLLGPHSYDPGISPSGVFWTTPIPEDGVDVHLGKGAASVHVTDVNVVDAFTVPNSLNPGHPLGQVPATIDTLNLEWSGVTRRVEFSDADIGFAGLFLENSCTVEVTATTPPSPGMNGFHFVSDAGSTTVSVFAQVGHDHNGVFFP